MNTNSICDYSPQRSPQLGGTPSEDTLGYPQRELAFGVLQQAIRDLRRFKLAQDKVGRELYLDAYSWISSADASWPYSFVNVCEVLGTTPETLRIHVLDEVVCGWLSRCISFTGRLRRSVATHLHRSAGRKTLLHRKLCTN